MKLLFLLLVKLSYIARYINSILDTSMMELFVKIVTSWKPLNIFVKSFVIDVRQGPKYASTCFQIKFLSKKMPKLTNVLCSKLTVKTPEHFALFYLLLNLSKFWTFFLLPCANFEFDLLPRCSFPEHTMTCWKLKSFFFVKFLLCQYDLVNLWLVNNVW